MKGFFANCGIVMLLVSGCASSPSSSTAKPGQSPITEETVTRVPGTDRDLLILRQPGGAKDRTGLKRPGDTGGGRPDSETSAEGCRPGQLMAIRVVSGETGTRTTQECVTPFASMGQKYKRQRPFGIKIRNAGGSLKVKEVTRKQ
ncbi:MAG: hypothetical protein ACRERU_22090 [Methylococcales bacterium]